MRRLAAETSAPIFPEDPAKLRARIAELEAEIVRLRGGGVEPSLPADILEATHDAVVALDANLCIRYCNAAAERMYGVKLEEVVGQPLPAMHGYAWLAPEDEARCLADLTERGSWKGEYIHILRDGSQLVVHCTVNVLGSEGGGMVAVIRDITGRKQAERKKEQQAAQLARANEELLHFAYAVSHDLQAPVRTIVAFSQMLALTYKPTLDERGSQLLSYLADAGARMSAMIRDLLEFAQVAGGQVQLSGDVSLEEVLETALENLRSGIEETGAAVSHDPLPTVAGDAGQLIQLFQNLIGNSLKYRKPDSAPRIHVSVEQSGAERVVSIRDNGIGFEPQHAERIFGVFQRLHGKEFAGTGIGLTICKRIVERRGGRIWADGRPGEGATFSFSIPDSVEAIHAAPPMDWDRLHTVLESHPDHEESAVPTGHFDELFKTLDLAQAVVRKLDGTILIWTKGAERLFGWRAAEAVGQHLHEFLRTELPQPLAEIEGALLRSGEWIGELKAHKRDGQAVWLASHKILYRDGSGRPQSVIEVHNDISALKEAEAALVRSSEQRDLALRAGQMGVWRWDSRTGEVEWSETLERMLGMEPGTFEGTYEAFQRRSHPDDWRQTRETIAEAFERGPDYTIENRLLKKDGSYCWVRGQGRVVFDENKQPAGLIGVVWDISGRRQNDADQQFLLDLSAKVSRCSERSQLADIGVRETAQYLGVPRCIYSDIDQAGKKIRRLADYHTEGPSIIGSYPLDGYDGIVAEMASGRFVAVNDVTADPRTVESCETDYLSLGTRAFVSVPLHCDGAWVAAISVTDRSVRCWEEREIALLRGVAERLWPAMENARLLEEARERQQQFEATFEQAAVGMAHVGLDGGFLRVNQRFCHITGYTAEELLRARFQDITHADDLTEDLRAYEALKRGETQSYALEKRYRHKTGTTVWVNLTVSLVRDSLGAPKYAISVIEDISARKKTAQELAESNALAELQLREIEANEAAALEYADRLSIATAAAQLGVFVWSVSNNSTSWENQRLYEIFGRTAEEGSVGESEFFEKVLHPDDAAAFHGAMAEAMTPGHGLHSIFRIRRKDGEWRWVEASGHFDLDADGKPLRLIGVVADVTDRMAAERALRDQKQHLRNVLDSLFAFVGVMSVEGVLLETNRAPLEAAGLRAEEVIGKLATDTYWFSHSAEVRDRLREAIHKAQAGESSRFDIAVRMKDDQLITVDFMLSPLRDEHGEIQYLIPSGVAIEERKQMEEALRRSEERYRLAEWATNDGLWDWNPTTDECYFSARFKALLGLAEDELENRAAAVFERIHPDDAAALFEAIRLNFEERRPYDVEMRVLLKRGEYRWFRTRGEALRDEAGKVTRMVGAMSDVHDRKEAEWRAREHDEQLRQMIDSIEQLAWMAQADGSVFWYNRRWYEYTGTTAEQMEDWGWQWVDPKVLPKVMERRQESIRTGEPFDMEFPLLGADGVYRSFLTRIMPLRDSQGRVVRWFGTNTNVEALRREQDVLIESERKFRELAETLPELVWVAAADGKIVYYNPQWHTFTGLPKGAGLADSWVSLMHPEEIEGLYRTWQTCLAGGQHYEFEARARRHDGVYRWLLNRAEPIRDEQGNIVKWIGTSTDIHERKLMEQALSHSNEDLEQFAYAASHDLQESLRTVSIYSQLLARKCEGGGADAARFAGYVVSATTRMDSLLKGILAYSRVAEPTEGAARCDSELVFTRALHSLAGPMAGSNATVTRDSLPVVACPESLLLQVFENLLSNAITYRSSAPLEIHVAATKEGGYWRFSIADNGIGIKSEYLKKIFGMFKRLHRDEYPGVGIGLAICKRVVERYGGRIWAESEVGEGATFHFTLPGVEELRSGIPQ
jgi:PAS domain S-box-containing protein